MGNVIPYTILQEMEMLLNGIWNRILFQSTENFSQLTSSLSKSKLWAYPFWIQAWWAFPTIRFCKSNDLNGLDLYLSLTISPVLQFLYPLDRCNPKNCIKFINLIIFRLKSCSKFCSQLFLRERYDYLRTLYNIYGALKIPSSYRF